MSDPYEFNPDNDELKDAFDAIGDEQDRQEWLDYIWSLDASPVILYDSDGIAELIMWFDTFDDLQSCHVHFIARKLSNPLATFRTALGVLRIIAQHFGVGLMFATIKESNRIGLKTAKLLGFNTIAKPSEIVYMVREFLD